MGKTATAMVDRAARREALKSYRPVAPGSVAEGELMAKYLPLVKTVAGRVAMTLPPHVDADDLQSAGVVGLLQAVRNFDAGNGASFETYARIRIRGAVMDELRRMDVVARSVREKARKVKLVIQEIEQRKGEPPSEEEMASALDLTVAGYQALLDEIRPVTFVCLDAAAPSGDDDGGIQHDSITDVSVDNPAERASRRELAALIAQRIQQLPEQQRKVLALYYYEGLRLREIAAAFRLTESRICQIHAQAILAIKSFLMQYEQKPGSS